MITFITLVALKLMLNGSLFIDIANTYMAFMKDNVLLTIMCNQTQNNKLKENDMLSKSQFTHML